MPDACCIPPHRAPSLRGNADQIQKSPCSAKIPFHNQPPNPLIIHVIVNRISVVRGIFGHLAVIHMPHDLCGSSPAPSVWWSGGGRCCGRFRIGVARVVCPAISRLGRRRCYAVHIHRRIANRSCRRASARTAAGSSGGSGCVFRPGGLTPARALRVCDLTHPPRAKPRGTVHDLIPQRQSDVDGKSQSGGVSCAWMCDGNDLSGGGVS